MSSPRRRSSARLILRFALRAIVLYLAPILAALCIGFGIASHWRQYRIFFAYGVSIAADDFVLVIDRELPVSYGYRYVGTAREKQTKQRLGITLAWNNDPGADSELRNDASRHWLPRIGSHRTPPGSVCSWFSINAFFPGAVFLAMTVMGWRGSWRRRGKHRCPECGYDRSGLVTKTACPECGTIA